MHRAWLLCLALAAGSVLASEKPDHERARAAVEAGEVMPLPALLEKLQRSHPGRVLELELEQEDGTWIYEVRLLQADGQLLKIKLDARTALVLSAKRRADKARAKP
jgi:uncharacterized membrane protein YkoI